MSENRMRMRNNDFLCAIRRRLAAACVLGCCLLTPLAWADAVQGDLLIHASGFADDTGQAVANIFRAGDNVLRAPYIRVTAQIQNVKATLTFPTLTYGSYAVSVFHDTNGNNQVDHNLAGMPAEPLGFSNGFKLGLFSGLPNYEKLRFEFSADTKPLEIVVK